MNNVEKNEPYSVIETWIFWGATSGHSILRKEILRSGQILYSLSGTWQDLSREECYEILLERGHVKNRKMHTIETY